MERAQKKQRKEVFSGLPAFSIGEGYNPIAARCQRPMTRKARVRVPVLAILPCYTRVSTQNQISDTPPRFTDPLFTYLHLRFLETSQKMIFITWNKLIFRMPQVKRMKK